VVVLEYDNYLQHFESRGTERKENVDDMKDMLCWLAQRITETENDGKFSLMKLQMLLVETSMTINEVFNEINEIK